MPASAATGRQGDGDDADRDDPGADEQRGVVLQSDNKGQHRAQRGHEDPEHRGLGQQQPADHGAVAQGLQDTDPVRGEHVRRRDVGVHPAGQDDGKGERALQREQPAARQQEPCAGHEQPVDHDHDGHLVGRAERLSHLGGDCCPEGAGHDRAPVPLALPELCQRRPRLPATRRRSAGWRPCHSHPASAGRSGHATAPPAGPCGDSSALRHDTCSIAAGQNALVLPGPRASKYHGIGVVTSNPPTRASRVPRT